jgi:hypothetical protein
MPDRSDALRARVLSAVAATPSATRRQGHIASGILVAASVAIAVAVFEGVGGLMHGAARPSAITVALTMGWAAVSAALTWFVLGRRDGPMMVRRPLVIVLAVVATPIVLFLWTRLFYGTYDEPYQAIGYRCLRYTLYVSALPLAAFLLLRRAVEPRYPAVLGAGAGAACASWAGALIHAWCPLTNSMHVLVGHVTPIVLATLVGAIVGQFTLGVRLGARGTNR